MWTRGVLGLLLAGLIGWSSAASAQSKMTIATGAKGNTERPNSR